MHSHFTEKASEACFNGCCSPFSSHKPQELEFSITTGASFLTQETKFTNHESLPSLHKSFFDLITTFPDYLQTDQADHIRSPEYQNLSSSQHVSLTHQTEQPLFSYSQFHQISESESNSSLLTLSHKQITSSAELLSMADQESRFQSRMRKRIMDYMNLEESEYHMILTQDRSSAFKILAELYSFRKSPSLLTVYNYEDEAVESMVKISEKKGIKAESAEFSWPSTEIVKEKLQRKIMKSKRRGKDHRGLFVFPLQSLVTGASYSFSWMSLAQEHQWHVLLDTSALGSKDMETLGLSIFNPDFLICSFIEVLGLDNPSGFGCLLIKKSSFTALSEPESITNSANLTTIEARPAWKTVNTLENDEITPGNRQGNYQDHETSTSVSEIIELDSSIEHLKTSDDIEFRGLDHADSLGLMLISRRSKCLTIWLIRALLSLHHPGSQQTEMPLVKIYGPKTKSNRGTSISFNIFDWEGGKVDPLMVQKLAEREKIDLQCAYLQNIKMGKKRRREVMVVDKYDGKDLKKQQNLSKLSVVSVKLGFLINFEDVFRVWGFVSKFLDADFVEKEKWRKKAFEKNK